MRRQFSSSTCPRRAARELQLVSVTVNNSTTTSNIMVLLLSNVPLQFGTLKEASLRISPRLLTVRMWPSWRRPRLLTIGTICPSLSFNGAFYRFIGSRVHASFGFLRGGSFGSAFADANHAVTGRNIEA